MICVFSNSKTKPQNPDPAHQQNKIRIYDKNKSTTSDQVSILKAAFEKLPLADCPITWRQDFHLEHFSWAQKYLCRLEICQKNYTTGFLGQKLYTLKVRKFRLFLPKKKQRKCINFSYLSRLFVKILTVSVQIHTWQV